MIDQWRAQTVISPVPFEDALAPDVHQSYEEDHHKNHHLPVENVLQMPIRFRLHDTAKHNRPGNKKTASMSNSRKAIATR